MRLAIRERRWQEQLDNPSASYRDVKYAQLAFLRYKLPHGFVTKYCQYLRHDMDNASLLYNGESGKAHYHGAGACGSVWVCPLCAERISGERRNELKVLLAQTKYKIAMVTFTFSHGREDALKTSVDALSKAIRAMKSKRAWRRFAEKWGLLGHVNALEVTHGRANGWHPHRHEMFVFSADKLPLSGIEARRMLENEMQAELFSMYRAELQRAGLDCDEEHGVKVSANRRDYGSYIAKWGNAEELVRGTTKQASNGGSSVWDLLSEAVRGDENAWRLFLEYARAFKGKKQLHWSKGLRQLLALPEDEKTDEEIAQEQEQQPEDKLVATFSRSGWNYLIHHDLLGPLRNYCERVSGDIDEVAAYLARMGLRRYVVSPLGKNSRFASAQSQTAGAAPPGEAESERLREREPIATSKERLKGEKNE